ncbi:sensor histidine kinase [Desulfoluna sp.]|uniref:sensor histidine kinase n=1 Tax=Desulfoluna sp. TaxID=2045199 RepID=UPI00262B34B0|nr:sensor histidine kinase [Desulfoluna sp.]
MKRPKTGKHQTPTLKPSYRYQRSGIEKSIIIMVALTALIFVAASAVMSQWSIRAMSQIVRDQFNREQMVVAHNVRDFIEMKFSALNREMVVLSREIENEGDPEKAIKMTLARVIEFGVSKIEYRDTEAGMVYTGAPFHDELLRASLGTQPLLPFNLDADSQGELRFSRPQKTPSGLFILLGIPVGGQGSGSLVCHVNISWLLGPSIKTIRSGRTGYAWIIDCDGNFLYHPDVTFTGQNAFIARKSKFPDLSFVAINKIQREEMLKGNQGSGSYMAGWHRGQTGPIEKLIAYTPVTIAEAPAQTWSIAVVAPVSEVEAAVREKYNRQFYAQLAVILIIIGSASVIMFFEVKWSGYMEKEANRQTDELVKSEAKYRSLVESAEDFIFTVDRNGIFQSMNSFTSNFFECRAEDHLGKGLSSLFPLELSRKMERLFHRIFESKKSIRKEARFDLGGAQIFIDANMVPVRSEEGPVNLVLCIARDITEDKKLERHLIHTEKLASLGTLAAGVAHEVNNPLGVILGFCDLLLRKKDPASQEYEDLKTIERQGLHCKEIVENLLSFVRTGENQGPRHTDLNLCLKDVIQIVRHRLAKEKIDLTTDLLDTLPLVRGDFHKLQQVFLNLINNAADAMPEGGSLTLRTSMDTHHDMAEIVVQDEGIAIAEKDIDHIFEPFFTTKPEGRGTGLGLFVSYGIITGFGGIMACESRAHSSSDAADGGTTFTVKLMVKS